MVANFGKFLFKNNVTILFLLLSLGAFTAANVSLPFLFQELFIRFSRNTFMVLSLLIPVMAGLGLNFSIIIGAIAAQVAIFLTVLWGGQGFTGILMAVGMALPLAIFFGFLVGKLFNSMKGTEMIGGMVAGFFSDGWYQLFFLFILGGVFPILADQPVVPTDVPALYPLYVLLAAVAGMSLIHLLVRLAKKQPLHLKLTLISLVSCGAIFGLTFVPVIHAFLAENRTILSYLVIILTAGAVLFSLFRIVLWFVKKRPGAPKRYIVCILCAVALFLITHVPIVNDQVMLSTGVGVLNALVLEDSIHHGLDNVPMINILDVAFFASLALSAILLIVRGVRRQPLNLKQPAKIVLPLTAAYALAFIPAVGQFLSADRLLLLYAVMLVLVLLVLYSLYLIIRTLSQQEGGTSIKKYLLYCGGALVLSALAFASVHFGEQFFQVAFDPVTGRMVADLLLLLVSGGVAYALFTLYRKKKADAPQKKGFLFILSALVFFALVASALYHLFYFVIDFFPAVFGAITLASLLHLLLTAVTVTALIFLFRKLKDGTKRPLFFMLGAGALFALTYIPELENALLSVRLPVLTYIVIFSLCLGIKWFMNTRLGQNMRTVGQDRAVAASSGIDVNRIRIIAMIMSTSLASIGQIISLQNIGTMATYGSHQQVALFSIAALLVGGASVQRATVKQALLGVFLFHTLFILSANAGQSLLGNAQIGEYFRVFVAYAVIAVALAMHAWISRSNKQVITQIDPTTAPADNSKSK